MNPFEIIILASLCSLALMMILVLSRRKSTQNTGIQSLAESVASGESIGDTNKLQLEVLRLQARQYRQQQMASFVLLLFSITVSLIIASIILFRLSIAEDLQLSAIAKAIGIFGGIGLSGFAFKLFKSSTKSYNDCLTEIKNLE